MGDSAEALCTALCVGVSVLRQPEELCLTLRDDSLLGELELPDIEAMVSCVFSGETAFRFVSGVSFRTDRAIFVRSRRERCFRSATLVTDLRGPSEAVWA